MASAKFLEEALSTAVDESAVSALVGSLETQLVTSSPASSTPTGAITTVNQNHINSAISNGGPVTSQKHGVSLAVGSVNNIMLNDASKTNTTSMATVQPSNIGPVNTVVASVAGAVNNRPNFVNQVTSSIGLTQTTLSNLSKGQESVRILYSTTGQASGGMTLNSTRLPFSTQTIGALQNGSVGLTSLPTHTVVSPATAVVAPNQLSTSATVNKQLTQNIGVLNAIEQAKASGAALVLKASGNQLGTQAVSLASAVMPSPMSVNSSVPMTVTSINSVVTGSTVTTSGSGVMTLSKPLSQAQTVGTQGNLLSGNVQILNVNAVRPATPGVAGQKPSRVVIGGSHIVGTRPGAPGQITLQALQGLTPGSQGLLLKTENGQFQLLRVGPPQTGATSGITQSSTTTAAGQTFRIQSFPALGSVAVAATSSSSVTTTTPVTATMQTTAVPVPALATATSTPAAQPPPRPAQVDTTKEKCRKFLANLLELSSREPKSVERNVRSLIQELVDCKVEPEEFCERLERLLNASPQPCLIGFLKKSLPLLRQALVTKELVIDGIRPPPANVVFSLATTTSTNVNVVPPLQATQIKPGGLTTQTVRVVTPFSASGTTPTVVGGMPTPRHVATVQHRLVTPLQLVTSSLTGTVNKVLTQTVMTPQVPITTSAPAMVSAAAGATVVTSQPSPIASPLPTSNIAIVPPSSSTPMLCRPGVPSPLPIQTRTLMPIKQTATTIRQPTPVVRPQSPIIRTAAPVRVTTPLNKTTPLATKVTPKLTPTQQRMQAKVPTVMSLSSTGTMGSVSLPVPALTSTDSSVSGGVSNSTSVLPTVQTIVSVPSVLTSVATPATLAVNMPAPVSTVASVPTLMSTTPLVPPTPVIPTFSSTPKQAPKEKEKKSFSSAGYTGDDDINDVAAMGGVNLAEETQRILGCTEFVGTQIRSCKDDVFLHAAPLQQKIRQIVAKHGLEEPTIDVAALISHATQERLKNLVEKLAVIAEHRLDIIKLDPRYEVTQDVKGQLKFLEELDRAERKRHDEKEREVLLRAAKSRSKSEDPEQAKLKAKAKEMQRAEMEEVRQREANMTALQAIGPRKKPRLDNVSGPADNLSSGSNALAATSNGSVLGRNQLPSRPRLKRVNLKDLLFLLEQEKETCRSSFLYKAYLK